MSTDKGTHDRTSLDGPNKSALLELTEALSCADGGQLMRKLRDTILQAPIVAEAAQHIGVARRARRGAAPETPDRFSGSGPAVPVQWVRTGSAG